MTGAISWPAGTGGRWMRPPAPGRTEPNAASFLPLPLAETPRVLGLAVGRERWKCSLCFCPARTSRRGLSAPGRGPWGWGGILPCCAPCLVLSPQRACPLTRSAPIPRRERVLELLRIENVVKYFGFGGAPGCLCSAPGATRRALNFTASRGCRALRCVNKQRRCYRAGGSFSFAVFLTPCLLYFLSVQPQLPFQTHPGS